MNLLEASFDDCEGSQFDLRQDDDGAFGLGGSLGGAAGEDAEEEEESSNPTHFPIKKLSEVFDTCAKAEGNMKVYLRVRPTATGRAPAAAAAESTITVESDTSIMTNAPDSSKRAQYTKTEERHYVRV